MKNKLMIMAGAAVALVGFTASVQAIPSSPSVEYSVDGGSTWTIVAGAGNGVSVSATTAGTWSITSIGGVVLGSATQPILDLSSLNVSGVGTLLIQLGATGFGSTAGGVMASVTGNSGNQVSFSAFADAGNTLFGHGINILNVGPLTGSFAQLGSGGINLAGPYSLTEEFSIVATSAGQLSSVDASLTTVPDGGTTVMLLGVALSGLCLIRKKVMA